MGSGNTNRKALGNQFPSGYYWEFKFPSRIRLGKQSDYFSQWIPLGIRNPNRKPLGNLFSQWESIGNLFSQCAPLGNQFPSRKALGKQSKQPPPPCSQWNPIGKVGCIERHSQGETIGNLTPSVNLLGKQDCAKSPYSPDPSIALI